MNGLHEDLTKAAVGTDHDGCLEQAVRWRTGLLVAPNDPPELARSMTAASGHVDLCGHLIEKDRRRVASVGWSATATQMLEIFRGVT